MRGVFAAGALDVFLENNFHPFDLAIGVSAGACNLASHLGGQHGRNRRCYFELMTRREFLDMRRFFGGHSAMDLDWLWDELARLEPLDVDAIARNPTEFVVVVTCRRTGAPLYLQPGPAEMPDALKCSSALPILYRRVLEIRGRPVVDGGVADPIPVEEAYRRGARRILVLRSRPASHVKSTGLSTRCMAWMLRREPAFADAVRATADRYCRAVSFMTSPPGDCEIVQVAPPVPLMTRRTTKEIRALQHDYDLGRALGAEAIERWTDSEATT